MHASETTRDAFACHELKCGLTVCVWRWALTSVTHLTMHANSCSACEGLNNNPHMRVGWFACIKRACMQAPIPYPQHANIAPATQAVSSLRLNEKLTLPQPLVILDLLSKPCALQAVGVGTAEHPATVMLQLHPHLGALHLQVSIVRPQCSDDFLQPLNSAFPLLLGCSTVTPHGRARGVFIAGAPVSRAPRRGAGCTAGVAASGRALMNVTC